MEERIVDNRNRSVDIFRYICAIMVVAIHTHPFEELNGSLSFVFTGVIPRIAVPFFFVTAGYYYIDNLQRGKAKLFPYLFRILKTYFLWSCVYFIVDYITWGHLNLKGFLVNCIGGFTLWGSYMHFWFFPALIFSVCLTTLIYYVRGQKFLIPISLILYVIGCIGCSYKVLGMQIPGLSVFFAWDSFTIVRRILMMGFPFFVAGGVVSKIEKYAKGRMLQAVQPCMLIGTVIIWILEVYAVIRLKWQESIVITFGLYLLTVEVMLFLLEHPMPKCKELSKKCRILANQTYYIHPLIILVLDGIAYSVSGNAMPQTWKFLSTTVFSGMIGMGIYYMKMRIPVTGKRKQ